MRILLLSTVFLLGPFTLAVADASAHCQVPCGIYADHADWASARVSR